MSRLVKCVALSCTFSAVFGWMAVAQTRPAAKPAAGWTVPLTPDGQPNFQGIWTNATVTPLERPADLKDKEFFTPAEAAVYEKGVTEAANVDRRRADVGQDIALAYNEAWWDRGTHVVKTLRTSLITDPKDGRLPPMTADGKARGSAFGEQRRAHPADGPENRGLSERCILYGSAGPPMMPGSYNNNYQIFQNKDSITFLIEMIHDTRIIPLNRKEHLPESVRPWKGDSIGHWEGNTLVVDTTNFSDRTRFRGTSDKMHLIERFTRTDAETIMYEYTVDDPATYTKPWSVQMTMSRSSSPIYEYACHEGNYGMEGILSGARADEAAKKK